MILLLTLAVGVVYVATFVLLDVPRQSRGLCERRPFKGGVSALHSLVVGWPELPQAESSTTLSKCEGPRDVPNVEAEIPGVEENALESRMRSNAPCALPDSLLWQLHATCAGVHDGFVYDLCWRAFESSGAHPLVISCDGRVVKILELPEDAACVRILARLHARIRLPSHVFSVWRWEGEVRCQHERLRRRVCGTK